MDLCPSFNQQFTILAAGLAALPIGRPQNLVLLTGALLPGRIVLSELTKPTE